MNAPAETASTTAPVKDSAIATFLKTLPAGHKANKSDQKAAGTKFKAFQAKYKAAEEALKALDAEAQDVAKEMLRAFGKSKITVDGVDFVPSCREERIFYKEMSTKGIEI